MVGLLADIRLHRVSQSSLFEPEFIKLLERLTMLAKKIFSGEIRPLQRSEKGASLEFHDYRKYTAGDDLRYVDWNVYRRLDQLVVKEYQAERELTLTIGLDASDSMMLGEPSKLRYGIKLAAAVGYIGLHLFEEVKLIHLPFGAGDRILGYRSTGQIFEFFTDLERHQSGGCTDLSGSLRHLLARHKGGGRTVLVSDFAAPVMEQSPLRYLTVKRLPADLLHLVAPDEIEPRLDGSVVLTDPETGQRQHLQIGRSARERYRELFQAHAEGLREGALRSRMTYQRARTDALLEDTMRTLLETGGLLR